ncbi:hypothetical protein GCM10022254_10010 [Actinomadura meridiana]|uniref:Uncharacterized protein n=1 Tax=Actinomadura meridiana TaxID=559626 RepID=A0ABP8BTV2_9ACTN
MCERFHCLPSQIDKEDARLLKLLRIRHLGTPQDRDEQGEEVYPGE